MSDFIFSNNVFIEAQERSDFHGLRGCWCHAEGFCHSIHLHRPILIFQVIHRHQIANCPRLLSVRRRVTAAQLRAAVTIQAYIRGFLERKTVAVLRAEMRVFGALQVRRQRDIQVSAARCSKPYLLLPQASMARTINHGRATFPSAPAISVYRSRL